MSPTLSAAASTGTTVQSAPESILPVMELPRGRNDTVSPFCSFTMYCDAQPIRLSLRVIDHQHRRPVLHFLRLARMSGHHPVIRIAMQHEAVVGVLAVGPELHRLLQVPCAHLAAAWAVGQIDRQE